MAIMDDKIRKLCAQWWADRLLNISTEKRELFKKKLMPKIEIRAKLFVDYDPSSLLTEALIEAGIPYHSGAFSADGLLPSKTCMNIWEDEIEVSEGYGAPFEVING